MPWSRVRVLPGLFFSWRARNGVRSQVVVFADGDRVVGVLRHTLSRHTVFRNIVEGLLTVSDDSARAAADDRSVRDEIAVYWCTAIIVLLTKASVDGIIIARRLHDTIGRTHRVRHLPVGPYRTGGFLSGAGQCEGERRLCPTCAGGRAGRLLAVCGGNQIWPTWRYHPGLGSEVTDGVEIGGDSVRITRPATAKASLFRVIEPGGRFWRRRRISRGARSGCRQSAGLRVG